RSQRMNVRRFVGKNAREAMAQARAAYGDQAVVLSNRPVPGGVEILAMPSADVPVRPAREEPRPAAARVPAEPMSTVSFEAFVRERQRQDAQAAEPPPAAAIPPVTPVREPRVPPVRPVPPLEPARFAAQALAQE